MKRRCRSCHGLTGSHIRARDVPCFVSPGLLQAARAGRQDPRGVLCGGFRNHVLAYLIAELFEVHDRGRFEWFAFSVGPYAQDEMRQRVAATFGHFIDVRERSDIDIAVGLAGFTRLNRFWLLLLSLRSPSRSATWATLEPRVRTTWTTGLPTRS